MECSKQVILEYYTTFTGFNEVDEMKHSVLYLDTILNWLYIKKGKQIIIFFFNCVIHSPWLLGNQGLKVTPLYGCVTETDQKLRILSSYLIYNLPGVQECISLACHWCQWCTEKGEWDEMRRKSAACNTCFARFSEEGKCHKFWHSKWY